MGAVKQLFKRAIVRQLPRILRRLSLEERLTLFRQTTRIENLLIATSNEESLKSLTLAARKLGIPSFAATGDLGIYEGSVADEKVHGRYALEKTWAADLQRLLADAIFRNREGTYLDVGANIGLTSIPLAKATNVACIAFEPEPNNFLYLRKNLIANAVERQFTLHHCALFSEDAILDFELSAGNHGDHRVRRLSPALMDRNDVGEDRRQVIKVPAHRLDDVVKVSELKKPVACKIDTQGAEVRVLRGGRGSMRLFDYLILEYWPYGLARMGDSVDGLIAEIREFPYGAIGSLDAPEEFQLGSELQPIEQVMEKMRDIGKNQSISNYVDVFLCRVPTLNFTANSSAVLPSRDA